MINFCEDISLMLAKAAKPNRDQAGINSSKRTTEGESDDQTTYEQLQKVPIRKY